MKWINFNLVNDHVYIHSENFIKKNSNIKHDKVSNELKNVDKKFLNFFDNNV
jgi:uncharacterized protein YpuA (DUF1002 family)